MTDNVLLAIGLGFIVMAIGGVLVWLMDVIEYWENEDE